jgi:hypothetical protein
VLQNFDLNKFSCEEEWGWTGEDFQKCKKCQNDRLSNDQELRETDFLCKKPGRKKSCDLVPLSVGVFRVT